MQGTTTLNTVGKESQIKSPLPNVVLLQQSETQSPHTADLEINPPPQILFVSISALKNNKLYLNYYC